MILILTGIKHCGKSTQSKFLGAHFSCPTFDTDDFVKKVSGKFPREIYSTEGQEAFKKAESLACQKIISIIKNSKKESKFDVKAVIATGGGICENAAAVQILKAEGKFIFLDSGEKTAADRIVNEAEFDENGDFVNLPAYIAKKNPANEDDIRRIFHEFYVDRVKKYSALADFTVKMTADPPIVNMQAILKAVNI